MWLAAGAPNACGTKTGALPSLYSGLRCDAAGNIHIDTIADLIVVIANLVQIAMMLAGGFAVLAILVSGFFYVTSQGDPGRTKRAKEILLYSVIGLVVVIGAYALVGLIASGL